jgi:flagellar hook assembly protein FlgD
LVEVSPNPFSYGTYISYELKESGRVDISVYSIIGMKVKTLANNTGSVGDKGKFYWDGNDQNGQALPAGAYILRMTVDDKVVEVVKVVRK